MADKNTIKNWFRTGLRPSQAQFWAVFDSYFHKDEKIPIDAINDIQNILAEKADAEALQNHLTDVNAHANLFAHAKIYANGDLQVFKLPGNLDVGTLEVGDYCTGFVQGEFINANYLGGNKALLASFDI